MGLFLDNAHCVPKIMATAAVFAAKKQLRKELKSALAAMTKQQRQEESAILTTKVNMTQTPKRKRTRIMSLYCPLLVCLLQVLASEEYRDSQRLSVYLTMPAEVDTQHILEVH